MYGAGEHFVQRVTALRRRARALRGLREFVGIPAGRYDLSEIQWGAIEAELGAAAARFEIRLDKVARAGLVRANRRAAREAFASELGQLELELAATYGLFDTFMDVLTQRTSRAVGPLLKGCDVLALDAMRRDQHPALAIAAAPIVYLNRGFGAAILRSGITISPTARAPLPLIQIPYARLQEKYHLASLVHEVGHEALVRLGMRDRLVRAVRTKLDGRVSSIVRDACARWMLELGPDFWAFGCCGAGQAMTVRDVLALPVALALDVRPEAVHPPVYFRTLIAFDWCRRAFGRGDWDDWEAAFRELHPISRASERDRAILEEAINAAIPRIGDVLFAQRFAVLEQRAVADLFELSSVNPIRLRRDFHGASSQGAAFAAERPTTQLAIFRTMREQSRVSERTIDQAMTAWLHSLSPAARSVPTTHRGRPWLATSRA